VSPDKHRHTRRAQETNSGEHTGTPGGRHGRQLYTQRRTADYTKTDTREMHTNMHAATENKLSPANTRAHTEEDTEDSSVASKVDRRLLEPQPLELFRRRREVCTTSAVPSAAVVTSSPSSVAPKDDADDPDASASRPLDSVSSGHLASLDVDDLDSSVSRPLDLGSSGNWAALDVDGAALAVDDLDVSWSSALSTRGATYGARTPAARALALRRRRLK
jgi:hypothetical protein